VSNSLSLVFKSASFRFSSVAFWSAFSIKAAFLLELANLSASNSAKTVSALSKLSGKVKLVPSVKNPSAPWVQPFRSVKSCWVGE
jgi:hypothetical protein